MNFAYIIVAILLIFNAYLAVKLIVSLGRAEKLVTQLKADNRSVKRTLKEVEALRDSLRQ